MTDNTQNSNKEFIDNVVNSLYVLFRYRVFILSFTFVLTILSIVYTLVVQEKYTATAVILPSTHNSYNNFGMFGGLYSSILGNTPTIGGVYSTYYIPELVKSKAILSEIIETEIVTSTGEKTTWMKFGEFKSKHTAIVALADNINGNTEADNAIHFLSVKSEDPVVSAQIANLIVRKIDSFNNQNRSLVAKFTFEHINQSIDNAYHAFLSADKEYIDFKSKHQSGILSPAAQSKKSNLESKQKITRDLYFEMIKDKERAIIELQRTTPVLTVLDSASVPEEKSEPKRKQIVILSFIFSMIFATIFSFTHEFISNNVHYLPEDMQRFVKNLLFIKK